MKKVIKNIATILMIIIMILLPTISIASSASYINDEIDWTNYKINETERQIDQVEEEMSEARKEINKLNQKIYEYEEEIEELKTKLSELETSIKVQTSNLEISEENFEKQEKLFYQRLVALYEAGETSYLDVLLGSSSISDFLSFYYLMGEIAEADNEMLQNISTKKETIEIKKETLETAKEQVEILKQKNEEAQKALEATKAVKNEQLEKLTATDKALQADLEQFERDKKELQAELARIAAQSNIIPGNPSEAGYIFPVAGLNIYNINNRNYPSYAGHTGVDVNINVRDKSVVAVKDGTVIVSEAKGGSIANYAPDGSYIRSYSSYGEYIIIDHHDGTMTLYGHMKPGSRRVFEGDYVVQGQVIGTVGNTGNVQPRPSPGNPYGGTHLHFEVRVNGKCVNPIPYLA